jgi:hypothetical protein
MSRRLPVVVAAASAFAAVAVAGAEGGSGASGRPAVRLQALELAAEDPMPGGSFVIVVNRGEKKVPLGCWRIVTRRSRLVIQPPAVLRRGGAMRLAFDRGEIGNPDRIRLFTARGVRVDASPVLHDTMGDDQLFSRGESGWTLGRGVLPERIADGRLGKPGQWGC